MATALAVSGPTTQLLLTAASAAATTEAPSKATSARAAAGSLPRDGNILVYAYTHQQYDAFIRFD